MKILLAMMIFFVGTAMAQSPPTILPPVVEFNNNSIPAVATTTHICKYINKDKQVLYSNVEQNNSWKKLYCLNEK